MVTRTAPLAAHLLLLLASGASSAAPPVVAVFDIENQGTRLPRAVIDRLTTYLTTRVAATRRFQVVPRDQIKQRLAWQKRSSYRECYAQSCQIEVGKELAASKSLATQLMKLGRDCVLTASLFDLKTAASEAGATARGRCTEGGIIELVDSVVGQLTGSEAGPKVREANPPAEQGPRIVSGTLSRTEIQRVVNDHMGSIQHCYEQTLVLMPGLAGRVMLQWIIAPDGQVSRVEIVFSTLQGGGVESCIVGQVRTWRFPRPTGGPVQVRYPFVFRSSSPPPPTVPRNLTRSQVQQGMRSVRKQVQRCYARYRRTGTAIVAVTIDTSGRVARAVVKGAFADSPTGTCIGAAVRSAKFPPFSDGPLHVTYPFVLR